MPRKRDAIAVATPTPVEVTDEMRKYGKFTARSFAPNERLSFPRWQEMAATFRTWSDGLACWTGDWLNFGEDKFGERFAQAADATGRDPKTLLEWARVTRSVAPERRLEELYFAHYSAVSILDPEAQAYWLGRALEGDKLPNGERKRWSAPRLAAEIKQAGKALPPGLEIEVLDKALVPDEYLRVDVIAVRKAYADGTHEIPGLRIAPDPKGVTA